MNKQNSNSKFKSRIVKFLLTLLIILTAVQFITPITAYADSSNTKGYNMCPRADRSRCSQATSEAGAELKRWASLLPSTMAHVPKVVLLPFGLICTNFSKPHAMGSPTLNFGISQMPNTQIDSQIIFHKFSKILPPK